MSAGQKRLNLPLERVMSQPVVLAPVVGSSPCTAASMAGSGNDEEAAAAGGVAYIRVLHEVEPQRPQGKRTLHWPSCCSTIPARSRSHRRGRP